MVPFCVASYSGIVNQEKPMGTFNYLFPTESRGGVRLVAGLADSVLFLIIQTGLTIAAVALRTVCRHQCSPLHRKATGGVRRLGGHAGLQ